MNESRPAARCVRKNIAASARRCVAMRALSVGARRTCTIWVSLLLPFLVSVHAAIAQQDLLTGGTAPRALAAPAPAVLPLDADGRCRIWLRVDSSLLASFSAGTMSGEIAADLARRNVEIEGSLADVVQLRLPPEEIAHVEQLPGARGVFSPLRAWIPEGSSATGGCTGPGIVSEGLTDMRVAEFRELGYDGSGIRIGIVDVGFAQAGERIGNELPPDTEIRYFGGADPQTAESHGTACAEIVHDIAPGAKLYLAGVSTAVDLRLALEWLVEERVEVISHSLAWFLGGGDGSGPICDLVRDAHDSGITFVTASGNFARSHWGGPARDADGDSYLELVGSREYVLLASGGNSSVRLVLLWDRWPTSTDLSFDLELLDGTTVVASSEFDYAQSPYAYREVAASGPLGDGRFRILLREGDPSGVTVRVFRVDEGTLDPDDRVAAGSLTVPADSPVALAAGAFSWEDQRLEEFSSYGPTVSGLPKPELVGPDRVCTSVPRYANFVGTSASCPHVAGAVGLLLSANVQGGLNEVHWSDLDIRTLLARSAAPLPDDSGGATGWGRVQMPLRPLAAASSSRLVTRGLGATAEVWLRRHPGEPAGTLRLYDVRGRFTAALAGIPEGSVWTRYRLRESAPRLRAGRYWAVAPSGGDATSLLWLPE